MTDLPSWFMPITPSIVPNYWVIANKNIQAFAAGMWTGPMAQVWIKTRK